jgi:hypothetical protein
MGIFRSHATGFVLAAGALLIANTADAAVPVAPLNNGTIVTQVAQGCGPGGFRDQYGRCHYSIDPGYGHGYGYGGPVNPDPHCTYAGCCPRGWTVQGGVCKPYRGY